VESILKRLAPFYEHLTWEPGDGPARLIGLARECAVVTLEPGAQLEISIGPALSIRRIEAIYHRFRAEIDPILDEYGYELVLLGYDPADLARDVPLIPKHRYEHMDRYFKGTGWGGPCMMRASASTQVSIDYAGESDAVRKFRLANALGPLLYFVTDNSPVFERTRIGGEERVASGLPTPPRMARAHIWNNVDASRSLVAPGTFETDFGFDAYARALLQAPAVFTPGQDGGHSVYRDSIPFAEVYAGVELDKATIEHILSLFFFDVRLKTYIEIRVADALPLEYALAFTALIKGVFYNPRAVDGLEGLLRGVDAGAVAAAKVALSEGGYEAIVYGKPAVEWLDLLIDYAREGLDEDEQSYLRPLARLVAERSTLARPR
jgi:glutamate--cysteine ligase